MEVTEEQHRRAEANRLAAVEKRKRAAAAAEGSTGDPWRLFKCRKIPSPTPSPAPEPEKNPAPLPPPPARFCVVLEICSLDEFSVAPEPWKDFSFPGEIECFRRIDACLSSVMPFRTIEIQGGRKASVYKLKDYESVLRCLKKLSGVELQDVPHTTLNAVQKFQDSTDKKPSWKESFDDKQVDDLLGRLPKSLRDALLPFQLDGVRFGLQRGGRCLIADEMGLGKTIQAIAIACCFKDEGSILVVCPAVLRFSWAEELEHWLPFLLPRDIHLVFGHQDNIDRLDRCPKVVVISYTMLTRLRKSMLKQEWALMIVDESHNLRCTKKKTESVETETILDVGAKVNRIILLSGTPSLSRPYDIYHQINMLWPRLLGKDKYEFAKNYCSMKFVLGCQGKSYMDFSKGIRLEELNVLLRQTLMIRRLKENVSEQLPPKRRQIIRLELKEADISLATLARVHGKIHRDKEILNESVLNCCSDPDDACTTESEIFYASHDKETQIRRPSELSHQEIGLAKLSGFLEWLSNHAIIRELEDAATMDLGLLSQKMVIFAHHIKVLDRIQEFICSKGIQFVRIDGSTLARDRQTTVESFRLSKEVKIAIIGITAGGVGLDFSSAQNVVFVELPKSASEMLQAEDRAHRRGQINAVNIYIFCAKDTLDESHWLHLNKSLYRVSSMVNGYNDAIEEIEVDRVFHFDFSTKSSNYGNPDGISANDLNSGNSVNWGMHAIRLCNGTYEGCEGSAIKHVEADRSTQPDTLQFEVDSVKDSNINKHSTSGNVKDGNPESIQLEQSSIVCSCKLDEGIVEFESMENIVTKAENMHDVDNGACELLKADTNSRIQVESLRFEVSQYTRRVHLYVCIPGMDLRPRPLFINFRPEDLELMIFSGGDTNEETTLQLLKRNPAYYSIFQTFIREWDSLRPIERSKLLGKPLQLPLSLELCYLKEAINHGSGGLLKGGSKRRVTPLSDISFPLPENSVWKKVVLCSGSAKEKEYSQAWTVSDEPLCKLCQKPCSGKLAKQPEFFEDLFCAFSCFQEYRIRTSQRALREALFQVEHGVCTQCKLDCHKLVKCIKPLSIARRQEYIEKEAPILANKKKLLDKLVHEPVEGNAWHADHIIPVYKGGGECRLENLRTLCVACHSEVTKAQRAERCLTRKRAKEQLKMTMKELEYGSSVDGIEQKEVVGDAAEEDLLGIKVPGSAYSRSES